MALEVDKIADMAETAAPIAFEVEPPAQKSAINKGYGGATFTIHKTNWEVAKAELKDKHFCYEATGEGDRITITLFTIFNFNTMMFEPA